MDFSSLTKLIRKEKRKVNENLEWSFLLYEDEEKPASEDPDKMLVVNKESGKSYYISKKSFDPAKHQKSAPKEKAPKKEEEEPAAETPTETPAETPAEPTTTTEPAAETPAEPPAEPAAETRAETPAEPATTTEPAAETPTTATPTETPKEPNEEKTGLKTVGFLKPIEVEKLDKKTRNLYPNTRQNLLQYDFEDALNMYDDNLDKKKDYKKLYKRIETIALAKHSLISKMELDAETIFALKHFYINSLRINNILNYGQLMPYYEIMKQIKLGKPKEGDKREKEYNSAKNSVTIINLDSAFDEGLQRLDYPIVSYRSVENKDVLEYFINERTWIDKSFVTTSLNPLIAEKGKKRMPLFEYYIPSNTSILTLPCHSNDYCHETEVTLPRNCRYTIEGFNEERNIYKVLVEQNYA